LFHINEKQGEAR